MTKGAYLQMQADECTRRAVASSDINLKCFYVSAAEGFRRRLEKLTIQELEREI